MNGNDGFGGPARAGAHLADVPASATSRGRPGNAEDDAAAVFALLLTALAGAPGCGEAGDADPPAGSGDGGPAPSALPLQLPLLPAGSSWTSEAVAELRAMLLAAQPAGSGDADGDAPAPAPPRAAVDGPEAVALPASQPAPGSAEVRSGTAAAPAEAPLDPHSPRFERQLGERLVWIARQGGGDARLHVHPEHLGPLDIRIRLDGDAAQVSLNAAHSATRELLEAALPRLREQFEDAGLRFAGADVGDRDNGNPDGDDSSRSERRSGHAGGDASLAPGPAIYSGNGLLDLFA